MSSAGASPEPLYCFSLGCFSLAAFPSLPPHPVRPRTMWTCPHQEEAQKNVLSDPKQAAWGPASRLLGSCPSRTRGAQEESNRCTHSLLAVSGGAGGATTNKEVKRELGRCWRRHGDAVCRGQHGSFWEEVGLGPGIKQMGGRKQSSKCRTAEAGGGGTMCPGRRRTGTLAQSSFPQASTDQDWRGHTEPGAVDQGPRHPSGVREEATGCRGLKATRPGTCLRGRVCWCQLTVCEA